MQPWFMRVFWTVPQTRLSAFLILDGTILIVLAIENTSTSTDLPNKEYWTQGARWCTNFFAFKASDLVGVDWQNVYGKGDDEEEFTGSDAERRDRHSCAVGSALVIHFSSVSQEQGLMSYTNLLKRYDKLSRRVKEPLTLAENRKAEMSSSCSFSTYLCVSTSKEI